MNTSELVSAWRSFTRRRGFAAVVFLTLTLGLAANITVFTVVNAVILRPLPYRDPGRLAFMWTKLAWIGVPRAWVSGPHIDRLRHEAHAIDAIVALRTGDRQLRGFGAPQLVRAGLTTANLFDVLGVRPMLGRGFVPEDEPRDVTVLSYDLWRQLGGDAAIVGTRIDLSGDQTEVIGVMPADFRFLVHSSLGGPVRADLWLPADWKLASMKDSQFAFAALVRVAPGQTIASAQAELDTIGDRIDRERFHSKGFGWQLVGLQDDLVKGARPSLLLIAAAAGVLLLVVCANLASMMLVRQAERQREFALRAALGASRAALGRLVLIESLGLALASAAAALALAWGLIRAIGAAERLPLPRLAELSLDWRVVGFAIAASVVASLAFGVLPALRAARPVLAESLGNGSRSASARVGLVRRVAVAIEVALAVVLVCASTLLARSYHAVVDVNPGFRADDVITAALTLATERYPQEAQAVAFHQELARRLAALPGVVAVGATTSTPLSGQADQSDVKLDSEAGAGQTLEVDVIRSTPGYLAAMGISLAAGRDFAWTDAASAPAVALVDTAFARALWPGQSPIGRLVTVDATRVQVVGLVAQARQYRLEADDRPQIYRPYAQETTGGVTLAIRTTGDPQAVVTPLRRIVADLDSTLPVAHVITMTGVVDEARFDRRLQAQLVGGCAAMAVLLSALGIYGLMAGLVASRTREIGIRLALGATTSAVRGLVIRQTAWLVAAGLSGGLVAALAVAGSLAHFLYAVSPRDPASLAVSIALVCGVAGLAAFLPIRRATSVDPARTLRSD